MAGSEAKEAKAGNFSQRPDPTREASCSPEEPEGNLVLIPEVEFSNSGKPHRAARGEEGTEVKEASQPEAARGAVGQPQGLKVFIPVSGILLCVLIKTQLS